MIGEAGALLAARAMITRVFDAFENAHEA